MNFLIKLACTVGFLGYLPVMPGTFGSLAGLALYFLIPDPLWVLGAAGIVTAAGLLLTGFAERIFATKDCRHIVLDEVAGMLIGLAFVPRDLTLVLLAFLMFRIFDTLKPFPAGRLQDLKGSAGIMLDDVVAGLYTNLVLQIIIRLI